MYMQTKIFILLVKNFFNEYWKNILDYILWKRDILIKSNFTGPKTNARATLTLSLGHNTT